MVLGSDEKNILSPLLPCANSACAQAVRVPQKTVSKNEALKYALPSAWIKRTDKLRDKVAYPSSGGFKFANHLFNQADLADPGGTYSLIIAIRG